MHGIWRVCKIQILFYIQNTPYANGIQDSVDGEYYWNGTGVAYTPLYEKGIKKHQNKAMETTDPFSWPEYQTSRDPHFCQLLNNLTYSVSQRKKKRIANWRWMSKYFEQNYITELHSSTDIRRGRLVLNIQNCLILYCCEKVIAHNIIKIRCT